MVTVVQDAVHEHIIGVNSGVELHMALILDEQITTYGYLEAARSDNSDTCVQIHRYQSADAYSSESYNILRGQ